MEADEQQPSQVLPPEERAHVDPDAWKNAHILTNSEARLLLARRMEQDAMKGVAVGNVMAKTFEYVTKFSTGGNEESMQEIRRILFNYQFKEHEVGIIANLMPETAEEAKTLVPSLMDPERFPDAETLEEALQEIAKYRE